jgi:hypothetical protein
MIVLNILAQGTHYHVNIYETFVQPASISVTLTDVTEWRAIRGTTFCGESSSGAETWWRGCMMNEMKHFATRIESDGRIIELKAFGYEICDIIITGQKPGARKERAFQTIYRWILRREHSGESVEGARQDDSQLFLVTLHVHMRTSVYPCLNGETSALPEIPV